MTQDATLSRAALIGSCCFSASQALLFVMYPWMAERLGLSLSEIVFCFSAGSLLFFWGSPYWSQRSDSGERGRILGWGWGANLLSLVFLALLLAHGNATPRVTLWLLLLSRLLYGALASGTVAVSQAILAGESSAADRMRALGTHSLFLNIGRFLGPILGLFLLADWPFLLLVLPAMAFALLLVYAGRSGWLSRGSMGGEESHLRQEREWAWPPLKSVQSFFLLAFLSTALLALFQSSLGALLQVRLELSAIEAGRLAAIFSIAAVGVSVIVSFLVRYRLGRAPRQVQWGVSSGLLLVGSLILLYGHSRLQLGAGTLLLSCGLAVLTPAYTSAFSLLCSGAQGRAAAVLSRAHTLGFAAGGLTSAAALKVGVDHSLTAAVLLSGLIGGLLWLVSGSHLSSEALVLSEAKKRWSSHG